MQERGIRRVSFVHLSASIHSVIAYRIVYFVAVEVDARFSPFVATGWQRTSTVVDNGRGGGGRLREDRTEWRCGFMRPDG